MAFLLVTSTIDTSVIERAIPEIVAFGRRSMIEQCVTSAAYIVRDAQRNTAAVEIGTIDSELEVNVTPITKTGRPSKAKKPRHWMVTAKKVPAPLGVLIVMARGNPFSRYSQNTGNRWPLTLPAGGPGYRQRIAQFVKNALSRMTLSRHSSTHFLQHGWAGARKQLSNSPYFVRTRGDSIRSTRINPLNTMEPDQLGSATIDIVGDSCLVTAENAVGEGGNVVLDAKHRAALILHGTPPLQAAIDKESAGIATKMQDYIDRGMKQRWDNVL